MKTNWRNIARKLSPWLLAVVLVILWEMGVRLAWLPPFIIPSPTEVIAALMRDWPNLMHHSQVTLLQALIGLGIGVMIAVVLALIMDSLPLIRQAVYPLLVVSQTIPTVAIAPILVLWLGYDMAPKIVLVVLTTVFPIVINLLNGFSHVDQDAVQLLKLMGANTWDILKHVKLPGALPYFFSGLRVSVSYAFVGSVVAEWLGGFEGLGVYMIQKKNAFSYDHMFAVIAVISLISLLFIWLVSLIERFSMPWLHRDTKRSHAKKGT